MKEYLIVSHGRHHVWCETSENDNAKLEEDFKRWIESLKSKDKWVRGSSLSSASKMIEDSGTVVEDGPYAESKEAMTGFFLVRADNFADAVSIARKCPSLLHDSVSVHELEA